MDISEIRRLNLLSVVTAIGGEARFVEAYDISQSQLWQWINRRRNIGEKAARKIEVKTGKPAGWLDHSDEYQPVEAAQSSAQPSSAAIRLMRQIEKLDEEGRLSEDLVKALLITLKLAPGKPAQQAAPSYQEPQDPPVTLEAIYAKQEIIDNRENLQHHKEQQLKKVQASRKPADNQENNRKQR